MESLLSVYLYFVTFSFFGCKKIPCLPSYMLSHCYRGLSAYQCVTQTFINPLLLVLLESLLSQPSYLSAYLLMMIILQVNLFTIHSYISRRNKSADNFCTLCQAGGIRSCVTIGRLFRQPRTSAWILT